MAQGLMIKLVYTCCRAAPMPSSLNRGRLIAAASANDPPLTQHWSMASHAKNRL